MTPLSSASSARLDGVDTDDPREDRQRAVLDAAARLLVEQGPHELSLRKVAAAAGGSTQLVYTLFGGKAGLADALYAAGFRRLGDTMRQAATAPLGDPEHLVGLGRGYVAFALGDPAVFSVMFGRSIPGFTPSRTTRHAAGEVSFRLVVDAARACLDAGTLQAPDAADLARLCWATAHGLASLQVNRLMLLQDPAAFTEAALRVPVDAHRPGQPLPVLSGR